MSAVLGGITLIWQEWIEFVFGVDPDRGDGSLEWVIVAVLAVVAVGSGLVARWEWRRTQAAS
ncbi:hypothetical protein AB0E69_26210 [Kribbella sp. NPDC026611]|uniref:hypothetical protein n=1 Tax=Kribbella sp. NPDC026611 TaxID=3154911 RepID=UPI0033DFABD8